MQDGEKTITMTREALCDLLSECLPGGAKEQTAILETAVHNTLGCDAGAAVLSAWADYTAPARR